MRCNAAANDGLMLPIPATMLSADTDVAYIGVFEDEAAAAACQLLTLKIMPSGDRRGHFLRLGGLLPRTEYFFRWRAHRTSAPSIVSGWDNFTARPRPAARSLARTRQKRIALRLNRLLVSSCSSSSTPVGAGSTE